MLHESKVYSFLEQNDNFAIHYLEGQRLIKDLVLIHGLQGDGLNFFRDTVLSFQPMIAFLKPNEGFGLYIDSEQPYFRLKIETNFSGATRSLLLPEDFKENPSDINGVARLSKVFQDGKKPYTTIIKLHNKSLAELSNIILNESYQIDAEVFIAEECDASMLIIKLPQPNIDKEEVIDRISAKEFYIKNKKTLQNLFEEQDQSENVVRETFEEKLGCLYLKSTEVKFKCGCSRERFIISLSNLTKASKENLIEEGDDSIEVTCDYCKTAYLIKKSELESI